MSRESLEIILSVSFSEFYLIIEQDLAFYFQSATCYHLGLALVQQYLGKKNL